MLLQFNENVGGSLEAMDRGDALTDLPWVRTISTEQSIELTREEVKISYEKTENTWISQCFCDRLYEQAVKNIFSQKQNNAYSNEL